MITTPNEFLQRKGAWRDILAFRGLHGFSMPKQVTAAEDVALRLPWRRRANSRPDGPVGLWMRARPEWLPRTCDDLAGRVGGGRVGDETGRRGGVRVGLAPTRTTMDRPEHGAYAPRVTSTSRFDAPSRCAWRRSARMCVERPARVTSTGGEKRRAEGEDFRDRRATFGAEAPRGSRQPLAVLFTPAARSHPCQRFHQFLHAGKEIGWTGSFRVHVDDGPQVVSAPGPGVAGGWP